MNPLKKKKGVPLKMAPNSDTVDKYLPDNAGDMGSIPGSGRFLSTVSLLGSIFKGTLFFFLTDSHFLLSLCMVLFVAWNRS